MRRLVPAVLVAALIAIAMPVRRDVAGLSMAPDLMPGDRVTTGAMPWRDRWRSPALHERWIFSTPHGAEAIKRVAANGPATLRIDEGDLELDGHIAAPPPKVLLERATVVRELPTGMSFRERQVAVDGEAILDDASFAPRERRVLLPVVDVGVCVVVRVGDDAVGRAASQVVIGVGDHSAAWRPSAPGSFAFLAGHVDRHVVAVAWRVADEPASRGVDGDVVPLRLPPDPPSTWSVANAVAAPSASATPRLTLTVGPDGDASGSCGITIERSLLWRDVLYRPAADGKNEWTIGRGEVFLLGDFPSGSIDSRRFGSVSRGSLRHRVVAISRGRASRSDRGEHPVGLVEHGDASSTFCEPPDRLR